MTPRAPEELVIQISNGANGSQIMKLSGPLTLQTLFEFQAAGRQDTSKPMILDISGVPYMDSAGLGSVISLFASCQRTNRGFGIVGLTERISTLFEVTHVDGLLPVYPSMDAAESAVSKTSA